MCLLCVCVCVTVIEQLSVFLKTGVGTETREILKRVTNDRNKSFYGNPIKNWGSISVETVLTRENRIGSSYISKDENKRERES